MRSRIPSYLRTHRRRAGFTQREMAVLLGLKSGQIISRYERLIRTPSLRTALGCQVIFGPSPDELFPGLYHEVEILTIRRILRLYTELKKRSSGPAAARKRDLLQEALERAGRRRNSL